MYIQIAKYMRVNIQYNYTTYQEKQLLVKENLWRGRLCQGSGIISLLLQVEAFLG